MSSWSVWSYLSLDPLDKWIPLDLHGFYKRVFDSLELLNDFLKRVVVSRRDVGIRKWTSWLREDLGSRPYAWLRPDFVPPSPFLVVKDSQTQSSRILVEPHLIGAEFRKSWMPFFCTSGHPVVTSDQFLEFVGHLLPQEPHLDLPRITGRDLQEVLVLKSLLLEVWMGGLGMKLRLCRCLGFLVWLFFWIWCETTGTWPQGLLDAYIAMCPKADGDSTSPVNGPSVCSRLCSGCGLPFGLDIFGVG